MAGSLYTKDQLNRLLLAWQSNDKPPRKGQALWIAFPNQTACKITKSPHKSTSGGALYLVDWNAHKELDTPKKGALPDIT